MGEKQPGQAPKVLASATARTKRPHKQHTGSDPKCSCDAYLTPVPLQDRSKNGEPNPFSRPDKLARLQAGPGRHLASDLEKQRCIDVFQTSQQPSADRNTVSPTGPKDLCEVHRRLDLRRNLRGALGHGYVPRRSGSCQRGCAQEHQQATVHVHDQVAHSPLSKNRQSPERAGIRR